MEDELRLAGTSRLEGGATGLVVRASVLPDVADELVIGGLPESQLPSLLMLFGLATVLAALAVSYLRRENRLAEERTDFVASVSHELRTPLAQIRLFVETLRLGRTSTKEQQEWALATIDREALRLSRLVENILRFSRSERGVTVKLEPLILDGAVHRVVEDFRPMISPRTAAVEVAIPAHLAVEADPDTVRQVLLNLLDNAVKYGPSGQTIRIEGGEEEGGVWLAVVDEGPGIPEPERNRVWESFHRGRRARGSVATGSGIGLSVVRTLMRAQGGGCRVEGADAGGARFVISWPSLRGASRQPAPSSSVGTSGVAAA